MLICVAPHHILPPLKAPNPVYTPPLFRMEFWASSPWTTFKNASSTFFVTSTECNYLFVNRIDFELFRVSLPQCGAFTQRKFQSNICRFLLFFARNCIVFMLCAPTRARFFYKSRLTKNHVIFHLSDYTAQKVMVECGRERQLKTTPRFFTLRLKYCLIRSKFFKNLIFWARIFATCLMSSHLV